MCLFAQIGSSQATVIDFQPGLLLVLVAEPISRETFVSGEPVDLEVGNLSTLSEFVSTSSEGSGQALAELSGWRISGNVAAISGNVSTELAKGAGFATASILNISTFDLLFPKPGSYNISAGLGVLGPFQIDPGDSGFARWELFLDAPNAPGFGFNGDGLFGESQQHECSSNGVTSTSCGTYFDSNEGTFLVDIGYDSKIPVTATFRFDIGVSRTVSVSEPSMVVFILTSLLFLAWLRSR